jgi:hypothetical protein
VSRRRRRETCDVLFAARRGGLYACTKDKGHDGEHRQGNAKPSRGFAIVFADGIRLNVIASGKA